MSRADPLALECLRFMASSPSYANRSESRSIESVFTEIWEQQSTGEQFGPERNRWIGSDLLSQLQLHLGSVCGAVRLGHHIRLSRLYQEFFERLSRESRTFTVVSFNYDTLVEQVLLKLGDSFTYGPSSSVDFENQYRDRTPSRGMIEVPVFKLHGSVNWGICRNCGRRGPGEDLINAFDRTYLPAERRARCSFCSKRFLDPGIVPPVVGKGAALRSFEGIWTKARAALVRAREIVIVGYSLPESDRQASALLRQIRGPLKRSRVTVICGPHGAPPTYGEVLGKFHDEMCTFEDFLENAREN